jgi:Spy/CpxP family protein refolding chaperone
MRKGWFLTAGLALLAAVSLAAAQPGPGGPGPGGPGGGLGGLFPKPGTVLPGPVQDRLNLTAEQKKQIEELQKEVDTKLAKLLTADQKKTLDDIANNPFGALFPPGGPGGPGGFPGGPGGPPGGNPGGFPGFGPGGFGRVSLDEVKKKIDATDEEWKVLGPKLQKVIAARQVVASDGSSGGFPGIGGFGGPPQGTNIITQAQADFKAVLDDPKHTKEELKEKAEAVRKARKQARSELDTAQKELGDLITKDQEEILVGLGFIE